ncbi:MAG: RNA polymerase sigma factor [Saprospiraceae bacterium]
MNVELLNLEQKMDHLFRQEWGRMVAFLTRIFGAHNLEMAEDIAQDTLLKALEQWKFRGMPDNPSAWLMTVAKNRAMDVIRRERRKIQLAEDVGVLLESEYTIATTIENLTTEAEIKDDQLRMMFACCHPALAAEAQITMILKTLCGFSIAEIAKAFLANEENINKRLYRARQLFREGKVALEIPTQNEIGARLDNVLTAIYLLFNEGYNATSHEDLIRNDLIQEALRLALLLTQHPQTARPEVYALLALMCFHAARTDSRLNEQGNILLLKNQDRTTWNQELIQTGIQFLAQSAQGEAYTSYHLEAGIAYEHCVAKHYESTNWENIVKYYDLLYQIQPTSIVALNRAIAVGEWQGAVAGLKAIEQIPDLQRIERYYLYSATLGEFYLQLQESANARHYFELALAQTQSNKEKKLLQEKLTATFLT